MDDIVLQKTASIERCLMRIEQEFELGGEDFVTNFSHQDAAVLNLQRACEQSIDLANHIIRIKKWGIPSTSRESFDILHQHEFISEKLALSLKKMVGFRNIAIYEYGRMNIDILIRIIREHLVEFKSFSEIAIKKMA